MAGLELKVKDEGLKRHHQQCPRMVRGWGTRGDPDASFVLVILEVASCHERGRVQETVAWLGC